MVDESNNPESGPDNDLAAQIALVVEMIEATGTPLSSFPMILTPDQVAEISGRKVSTIRALLNNGELPYRLVGKTKQVSKAEFVLWLVRGDEAAS